MTDQQNELLILAFEMAPSKDESDATIVSYNVVVSDPDDIDNEANSFPDEVNLDLIRLGLSLVAPHQRMLGHHLLFLEIISIQQTDEESGCEITYDENGEPEIFYVANHLLYHIKDIIIS